MTISFVSLLYTAVIYIIFYIVNKKARYAVLSLASISYVFLLNAYAGVAVTAVSLTAWLFGILLGKQTKKEAYGSARILLTVGILGCVSLLACFKYDLFRTVFGEVNPLFQRLVMPLGFSFYIFRVISYFTDIVKGKLRAETNLLKLILYIMWFPAFISGPIERKDSFDQQVSKLTTVKFLDWDRKVRSLLYIVTGAFYKLVLADRLGIFVDRIYAGYTEANGFWLLAGAVFYTFQIYCDFAGYSLAAVGISNLFGITLTENFNIPYLSDNITDFWRRWHISLSNWLRDYIYIPLGGNRRGSFRKAMNTMIVFVVCGLWHGSDASFLVWGILHGLYSLLDLLFRHFNLTLLRKGFLGRILTFTAVAFAWIFFRADTLSIALAYIARMASGMNLSSIALQFQQFNFEAIELYILAGCLPVYLLLEICSYRSRRSIPDTLGKTHYLFQYSYLVVLTLVILVFGIYGLSSEGMHMIYMQF